MLFVSNAILNLLVLLFPRGRARPVQVEEGVRVPKDHHNFIIGKGGQTIKAIQNDTATRITIPNGDEGSDIILIRGSRAGVERAKIEILELSEKKENLTVVDVPVKKLFHIFILGHKGETVRGIEKESGARVHIPRLDDESDIITVRGEKPLVAKAVDIIEGIYKEKLATIMTIQLRVEKDRHRFVRGGSRGTVVRAIQDETETYITIPAEDDPSESLTIMGEKDNISRALATILKKAESGDYVEIEDIPKEYHPFLIGRGGTTRATLMKVRWLNCPFAPRVCSTQ
jgi:polyribonucleotide nucleotidyltransferase